MCIYCKTYSTEILLKRVKCLSGANLSQGLTGLSLFLFLFCARSIYQSPSRDCGCLWKTYMYLWQGSCYQVFCLFCLSLLACTQMYTLTFWQLNFLKLTVRNDIELCKCCTHTYIHDYVYYRHHSESKKSPQFIF